MLEDFLQDPCSIRRHRQAPLREAFLDHLQRQGTSPKALKNLAGQLLHVIRFLKLEKMRDVSLEEIQRASVDTTNIYAESDLDMRAKALGMFEAKLKRPKERS